MRIILGSLLIAACELQPAPRQAPAPTAPVTDNAPKPAPGDAGPTPHVPADAAPVSNDCENIGVHVAQVLIDSAKDASLKANYEQARTKVVLATAEACTSQKWSDEARGCYLDAKVEADVRACEKKFPAPGK
jgi:hypothetical protein